MLSIKHNLSAGNANRQLNINTKKNAGITEKLTSGYRINRAADDAAGLAISEKMRRQVRGLHQASENVNDGISYVKTAEGALQEVQEMLQRINQLAVQAANGTNTVSDRAAINSEIQALKAEMNRVFHTTTFNEQRIWEPEESREIVDYEDVQAVQFTNGHYNFDITNENCGVIATSGYKIHATAEDGVWVTWTGYNGRAYETNAISWEDLEANDYSFNIQDLFKPEDADLVSPTTGEKLIQYTVSLDVKDGAGVEHIITAINNRTMSSGAWVDVAAELEGTSPWQLGSVNAFLDYKAAYASNKNSGNGYDFDADDDPFFKAVTGAGTNTNLIEYPREYPRDSNVTWRFAFYLEGIGDVIASPSSFSYISNDGSSSNRNDGNKDLWWYEYTSGGREYQNYKPHSCGTTLGGGSISSDRHKGRVFFKSTKSCGR